MRSDKIVNLPKQAKRKRAPRDLVPIDKTSGAARCFDRLIREVEADLGGRLHLSRIEGELIRGFAGCATQLQYLNHQIPLGEGSELDLANYGTLASTMLRVGNRLGLSRRPQELMPSLDAYLDAKRNAQRDDAAVEEQPA